MKSKNRRLRIISHFEGKNGEPDILTVKYSSENISFQKSLPDLYTKEWVPQLNHEDVAFLSFLTSRKLNPIDIPVRFFPRSTPQLSPKIVLLIALYIAMLLSANLTGYRLLILSINNSFAHLHLQFGAGMLSFPATYIISGIITEVWGYKISRAAIWSGFLVNFIVVLFLGISSILPEPTLHIIKGLTGDTYRTLFSVSSTTFGASMIAYFLGEFINTTIIAKMKIITKGRYVIARLAAGIVPAAIVDTLAFCTIMFYGKMDVGSFFSLMCISIFGKLFYDALLLPLAYWIAVKLKSSDNIDHYDYGTVFNPFSWK